MGEGGGGTDEGGIGGCGGGKDGCGSGFKKIKILQINKNKKEN